VFPLQNIPIEITNWAINVHDANLPQPLNNWRQEHLDQGFAWREKSIAFLALQTNVMMLVSYGRARNFQLRQGVVRAIQAPLLVTSGNVVIEAIEDGFVFDIPNASYCVVFQTGCNEDQTMWGDFTFCTDIPQEHKNLVCDSRIQIPERYELRAESA